MIDETGGEFGASSTPELAPVIPLFGKNTSGVSQREQPDGAPAEAGRSGSADDRFDARWPAISPASHSDSGFESESESASDSTPGSSRSAGADSADRWAVPGLSGGETVRPVFRADVESAADQTVAEVVPLFAPRSRGVRFTGAESDPAEKSGEDVRDEAAQKLVRKLRSRSLSVVEARAVLSAESVSAEHIDAVIDDFLRRGYLDDQVLAEQLVLSGIERKGQGRVALSRSLSQRGISRDLIDAALEAVPDDDAERALEYARTKARSLSRLDFDTALRRLVGQLARRGYNGSIAMTAARVALQESPMSAKPKSGVRFE